MKVLHLFIMIIQILGNKNDHSHRSNAQAQMYMQFPVVICVKVHIQPKFHKSFVKNSGMRKVHYGQRITPDTEIHMILSQIPSGRNAYLNDEGFAHGSILCLSVLRYQLTTSRWASPYTTCWNSVSYLRTLVHFSNVVLSVSRSTQEVVVHLVFRESVNHHLLYGTEKGNNYEAKKNNKKFSI